MRSSSSWPAQTSCGMSAISRTTPSLHLSDRSLCSCSPGLTSKGGYLPDQLDKGKPVAIFAEGKELPCAIGITNMSADEIKSVNKGHGIDSVTYLGDDLWMNAKEL